MKITRGILLLAVLSFLGSVVHAESAYPDGARTPEIAAFLGADGFGTMNSKAPPETAGFGRLVGLWDTTIEMRAQDGSWVEQAPALWAWQFVLDGFATQDLWFHSAENLPTYLGPLGRPYMLTGLRMFEPSSGKYRIAWAANGGGSTPGMDFGTLEGTSEGDDVVLTDKSEYGYQRITFSDVTGKSFKWTSELSQDGETWSAIMRVEARRRE